MPGLFDPPKGRKHQPLRRKREYTPSPLSQVTTPDAVHASKRSLAISALVEALQPPTKRKRDREDKILDSDISLAPERIPVVGMVKTRGFKTLERRKKPLERKPNKISRVIRQRKSRRRREKSLNFEMTPTAIEKIENLAQIIMSGFPRCNHPLWKRTPRSTVISEMEMPPAACIPSPLEQMRRQDREFNKAKPDTDAKDNVKPDLNPWDFDKQIIYCRKSAHPDDRTKLMGYLKWKKHCDKNTRIEHPGLSLNVYQRMATLKTMQQHLQQYDPCAQISNVKAILEAYRSGQLEWSDHLVTYWHQGQMIRGPMPFYWDEFETISRDCDRKGLWVECIGGPVVQLRRVNKTIPKQQQRIYQYTVAFRAPHWKEFQAIQVGWDTSADDLHRFMDGMYTIAGVSQLPPNAPVMGAISIADGDGAIRTLDVIHAEISILNWEGYPLTPWVRTQCFVMPADWTPDRVVREKGPICRLLFFKPMVPFVGKLPSIDPVKSHLHFMPENLTPYTGRYRSILNGPADEDICRDVLTKGLRERETRGKT